MKQIFKRTWTETFVTGGSGYVLTDPVKPGEVLEVLSLFAYAPEREASDEIKVGIRSGGNEYLVADEKLSGTEDGLQVGVSFYLGEGDRLFAYFPDADNGDEMGIMVVGALMSKEDFQGGLG